MPPIANFGGIAIHMYYNDHNPPHFHAECGGMKALIQLSDGAVIAGQLPSGIPRLVRDWALSDRRGSSHRHLSTTIRRIIFVSFVNAR